MQVSIGPSFFKKVFNDYSNWVWSHVREAVQNCIDAPRSTAIVLDIHRQGDDTVFVFSNNGQPMTEEELIGKLLRLGESGKDGSASSVGGFGIAKSLLYFCHKSYEIISGRFKVVGCGGDYELTYLDTPYPGTKSTVVMAGDVVDELIEQAQLYIYLAQWNGTFELNGKILVGRFRKGSKRREFSWGTFYTNRGMINHMVVRIDGIPMFHRYLSCGGKCVVVELNGRSVDVMQSNRDSLQWSYQNELTTFVEAIVVDKRSALGKDDEPVYLHYKGDKLQAKADADTEHKTMAEIINAAYATVPVANDDEEAKEEDTGVRAGAELATVTAAPVLSAVPRNATFHEVDEAVDLLEEEPEQVSGPVTVKKEEVRAARISVRHDFVIKNTTGMVVPECYLPANFGAYSRKVLSCWTKCLLAIHSFFRRDAEFSVGFLFDGNDEAQHERGAYGTVFYINPVVIVKQTNSMSRSMKKRWNLTPAGKYAMLSVVAHEYVHALGYSPHDEDYANKLTEVEGIVMANMKKFTPAFR